MAARFKFKVQSLKLKVALISFLLFALYFFLPIPTFAQTIPLSADTFRAPQMNDYTLENMLWGTKCKLILTKGCLMTTWKADGIPKTVVYNGEPGGGAIYALSSVMVALYNPPTSSVEYLADLGKNLGIIQPAYAQVGGSGAGIINPVLTLWQTTRNMSYVLFILIFITIGLMIMLRQKINPQTIVTIQTALPTLVIGLVLVTFSYFIAALLIDIAFVGIPLVAQVFGTTGVPNIFAPDQSRPATDQLQQLASQSNLFDLFGTSARSIPIGDISNGLRGVLDSTLPGGSNAVRVITGLIGAIAVGIMFLNPFAAIAGGAASAAIGPELIGLLIPLILIIAMFIQLIKLFLKLVNAYITILVTTIFGPLLILIGSIPGRAGAITFWWKLLLANALIFPAVFATFLFAGMILAVPSWTNSSPPLFGGFKTDFLQILIAYGIILGTPAVPDMVKEALGVKDLKGIPQAAMAGFGAGVGGLAYSSRKGYGMAMKGTGMAALKEKLEKEAVDNAKSRMSTATLARAQRILPWVPRP